MLERGIISGIWEKYKVKTPEVETLNTKILMRKEKNTQDCLGTGLEAMGFENLLGIFLILIFGALLSAFILLFEYLLNNICNACFEV